VNLDSRLTDQTVQATATRARVGRRQGRDGPAGSAARRVAMGSRPSMISAVEGEHAGAQVARPVAHRPGWRRNSVSEGSEPGQHLGPVDRQLDPVGWRIDKARADRPRLPRQQAARQRSHAPFEQGVEQVVLAPVTAMIQAARPAGLSSAASAGPCSSAGCIRIMRPADFGARCGRAASATRAPSEWAMTCAGAPRVASTKASSRASASPASAARRYAPGRSPEESQPKAIPRPAAFSRRCRGQETARRFEGSGARPRICRWGDRWGQDGENL
jgi:hypothetical protein